MWPLWTVACHTPLSMDFSGKHTGVGCHFLLQCLKVKSATREAPYIYVCVYIYRLFWIMLQWTYECSYLQDNDLISFGYIPKSWIAESCNSSTFLRDFHTDFHTGCTNLHPQWQCKRFPFSSQLCKNLWPHLFFINHPYWCEIMFHCGFYLHFSNH